MGILLQDSFTGPNGTLITVHTPEIGGAWLAGSSPPQIQNNRCKNMVAGFKAISNTTVATTTNRYIQAKIYNVNTLSLQLITSTSNEFMTVTATKIFLNSASLDNVFISGALYRIERVGLIVNAYENGVLKLSTAAVGNIDPTYIFGVEFAGINTAIDDLEAGEIVSPVSPIYASSFALGRGRPRRIIKPHNSGDIL